MEADDIEIFQQSIKFLKYLQLNIREGGNHILWAGCHATPLPTLDHKLDRWLRKELDNNVSTYIYLSCNLLMEMLRNVMLATFFFRFGFVFYRTKSCSQTDSLFVFLQWMYLFLLFLFF